MELIGVFCFVEAALFVVGLVLMVLGLVQAQARRLIPAGGLLLVPLVLGQGAFCCTGFSSGFSRGFEAGKSGKQITPAEQEQMAKELEAELEAMKPTFVAVNAGATVICVILALGIALMGGGGRQPPPDQQDAGQFYSPRR